MNRVGKSGTTHVTQTPSTSSDPASTPQTPAAQVRPRSASLPLKALKALKSAGQLAIGPMRDALGAAGIAKSSGKSPRQAPAEDYIGSLRSKIRPSPSSRSENARGCPIRADAGLHESALEVSARRATACPAADGAESSAAAARVPKKVKFNDVVLKEEFIDKPRSRKEGEVLGRSSSIRLGSPDGGGYVHQRPDKLRAAQNVSVRKILINQQAEALSTMGDAHPGPLQPSRKR